MKVEVKQKVEISEEEQRKITLEYLQRKFQWRTNYIIEKGKVFERRYDRSPTGTDIFIRNVKHSDYLIQEFLTWFLTRD